MKTIFLVDADDTILDFHAASALSLRSAFAYFSLPWEERFLSEFRRINDGLWEALERKELTRDVLMEKRFPLYLQTLDITDIDGATFNERYLHALSTNPVYIAGAQTFLERLRRMGKIYIVTNGTEWIQKSRFDICGLWSYAEDVFISQTIGADKPSPKYTNYVVSRIEGFQKENAVWIGDSLSADIRAANDADIASIWFNPRKKTNDGQVIPDYEAQSFEEILQLLEKID